MKHGTVSRLAPTEAMALDDPLEPSSLPGANYIDSVIQLEDIIDQHLGSNFERSLFGLLGRKTPSGPA